MSCVLSSIIGHTKEVMSTPMFSTPEDVETAFYKAINHAHLGALMEIWAEEEEVMCLHPNGTTLRTLEDIRESWREVLQGASKMELHFRRIAHWQGALIAVHQLVEHLRSSNEASSVFRVTHIFLRGPYGWRLACRHASSGGNEPIMQVELARRVLH
jgi:ketosteroid isomerase-like protein